MNKRLTSLFMLLAMLVFMSACQNAEEIPDPYESIPNPVATITMETGETMQLELYVATAPNTVANFTTLANSGFYDGLTFHRVIGGCLIQGGDPLGTGLGATNYTIAGEFSENGFPNDLSHTRGVISLSRLNSDMNSGSSQFFIMQGSYPEFDGKYAAFGKITDDESLDVLDSLCSTATDASEAPLVKLLIRSIRVDTKGYKYTVVKYGE